jgi:cytochrome b561
MLSAAPYPIVFWGGPHLPPIVPQDPLTYAWLRRLHMTLALLLFATILLHFGAALFHALIRRDGVFESMASWRRTKSRPADPRP